jgi:hypothetical protein
VAPRRLPRLSGRGQTKPPAASPGTASLTVAARLRAQSAVSSSSQSMMRTSRPRTSINRRKRYRPEPAALVTEDGPRTSSLPSVIGGSEPSRGNTLNASASTACDALRCWRRPLFASCPRSPRGAAQTATIAVRSKTICPSGFSMQSTLESDLRRYSQARVRASSFVSNSCDSVDGSIGGKFLSSRGCRVST